MRKYMHSAKKNATLKLVPPKSSPNLGENDDEIISP